MSSQFVALAVAKKDGVHHITLRCASPSQAERIISYVNADPANNAVAVEAALDIRSKPKDPELADIMRAGWARTVGGGTVVHGGEPRCGAAPANLPQITADFVAFFDGQLIGTDVHGEQVTRLRSALQKRVNTGLAEDRILYDIQQLLVRRMPQLYLHPADEVLKACIRDFVPMSLHWLGDRYSSPELGVRLMMALSAAAAQFNGACEAKLLSQLSILVGAKVAASMEAAPDALAAGLRLHASTCDRDKWQLWDGVAAGLMDESSDGPW